MTKLTENEWERLREFDTSLLLTAVDQLDRARAYLSDGIDSEPLDIRQALMALHELAMQVVHHEETEQLTDLFENAEEISHQVHEIQAALDTVGGTVDKLLELWPDQLYDDD